MSIRGGADIWMICEKYLQHADHNFYYQLLCSHLDLLNWCGNKVILLVPFELRGQGELGYFWCRGPFENFP